MKEQQNIAPKKEPKATITVDQFLESDFLTSRGLGRNPKKPIEKLFTGNCGEPIKTVHIYGDRKNLAVLHNEIPTDVNIVHHASIADGEIYEAQL